MGDGGQVPVAKSVQDGAGTNKVPGNAEADYLAAQRGRVLNAAKRFIADVSSFGWSGGINEADGKIVVDLVGPVAG